MKKLAKLFLILLLALLLCVAALAAEPETAEEIAVEPTESSEHILQAGGLFETAAPRRGGARSRNIKRNGAVFQALPVQYNRHNRLGRQDHYDDCDVAYTEKAGGA